jgi:5-dehydro-4-deoxyglucarate dehydratase
MVSGALSPAALRARLHGVVAFPVTPFARDLSVDLGALRQNVRMMAAHPLAAIVAPSGTGEVYSLTAEEHGRIVRAAVEEANAARGAGGPIPVIAGVAFNGPSAAAAATAAATGGASGILAFPPYYPLADDDGLLDHYRALADATPLGLLVYSRDWYHPGPAFVERLAAALPTFIAWKEGQGDIRRLQILRAHLGDRLHWIGGAGDDLVPAYYSIGLRAFTSSISNISPSLALQLHESASAGDSATLLRLMSEFVVPLYALRTRRRGYEVTIMKELMNLLGMPGGVVRPPLPRLTDSDLHVLRALVPAWKGLFGSSVVR